MTNVIPDSIRATITAQRCAVLGTSDPECDHKDGHRDDWGDPAKLTVDDFQPLSSAANKAKRQACKECRETKRRFDATTLASPSRSSSATASTRAPA